jgi:glutamine amidotransferase
MPRTVIIDYGMGNLDSMARAVEKCGATPVIGRDADALAGADKAILPGVGAFPHAMRNLQERGLVEPLRAFARGKPLLGVCLGMQLLATRGSEIEAIDGLGLIDGTVERLAAPEPLRVPHVGWNDVEHAADDPLFAGIPPGKDFYFVHSFQFVCADPADRVATTSYGGAVTAAVRRGLLHGVQFHPEKSQQWGLRLLNNFLAM